MAKGSALRKPENDTSSSEFAALLDESLGGSTSFEGSVVKGTVIRVANDFVTIDVGLKSEGRVALREFSNGTSAPEIKEGDVIDIFVDRMENKAGEAVLSRDKARREEAWTLLEKAFNDQERVMGTIFGRVKGGFTVDLSGAVAFLPGSQVDVRPVRDVGTVICPDAPVKLFVTASPEARAERRYQELRERGADTIKPRVLAEMAERDRRDSERAAAPLKAAPDAWLLDTSDMDADAAFAAALAFIERKGFRSSGP